MTDKFYEENLISSKVEESFNSNDPCCISSQGFNPCPPSPFPCPSPYPYPNASYPFAPTTRVIQLNINDPDEEINLLEISQIDNPDYFLQAIHLANAFQKALVPVEGGRDGLRFSMLEGLNVAKTIQPAGAVVKYIDQTLTQTHNTVSAMIDRIVGVLQQVMGVALSGSVLDTIQGAVTDTFTNLASQENKDYIFWSEETSSQTSYVYNMLFSIQNAATGRAMMAVPIGLQITANKEKQQLLGITVKDYADYSVNMQSLRFAQPLVNTTNFPIKYLKNAINGTV